MNKGIGFYFGYVYKDIEQQVKDIKSAGFDCVMDTADTSFKHENGSNSKRFKLHKKYGLKLSSLHMRYKNSELPNFWCENKIGRKVEKDIIKDVKVAHKYGFKCVVVHLFGEYNEIGLNRLKRILKVCEKLNVPLALENLIHNKECLDFCFNNIQSDYLKFCFDSGHWNAFDPEIDFLKIYKDKLIALHLHDNLGANRTEEMVKGFTVKTETIDMHTLNKYGNIDWDYIATRLADVKQDVNLDYEVMMHYHKNETSKECLAEVFKQVCELEEKIRKLRK